MGSEDRLVELNTITEGRILFNEPMANHTTLRIGGPAEILVIPASLKEIPDLLTFARREGLETTIIGNGSNLLVQDGGLDGLVIKLAGGPREIVIRGSNLIAESGAMMPRVARMAWRHGLTGVEFMAGIPGTVGGGLVMNAGAYGQSMDQIVEKVEILDPNGGTRVIQREDLTFGYRTSSLQRDQAIITKVYFQLDSGDLETIKSRMDSNASKRRERQPLQLPNAGSIFTNQENFAAGYLIEQAGLKGLTKGGAQVSLKHANFIVNKGGATAKDVNYLIEKIKSQVRKKFGEELETEIFTLGKEL